MLTQKAKNLPPPDHAAAIHSKKLVNHLNKRLAKRPLSFAEFMQEALYAPGLGYYQVGTHKLGQGGDFTTAPEISPFFGSCLAIQCAEILNNTSGKNILEFGAGTGKLAADILQQLKKLKQLPHRYFILEISPDLQQRQLTYFQQEHPELLQYIEWITELPCTFSGAMLANEVIDAMPVNIFHWDGKTLNEQYINRENDRFVWQLGTASAEVRNAFIKIVNSVDIAQWQLPYQSEVNLYIPGWINSLNASLQDGAILLIDYGFTRQSYYHAERKQGTLMCHYQHQAHTNPLILLGLQDITAHVDFTAVIETASHVGLTLEGFVTQANFLLNTNLTDLMSSQPLSLNEKTAIKRLIMPNEMGEKFKVMGLSKNYVSPLKGFSLNDISHKL